VIALTKNLEGVFKRGSQTFWGRTMRVNGEPRTLVGVMPPRFQAFWISRATPRSREVKQSNVRLLIGAGHYSVSR